MSIGNSYAIRNVFYDVSKDFRAFIAGKFNTSLMAAAGGSFITSHSVSSSFTIIIRANDKTNKSTAKRLNYMLKRYFIEQGHARFSELSLKNCIMTVSMDDCPIKMVISIANHHYDTSNEKYYAVSLFGFDPEDEFLAKMKSFWTP